MLTVLTGLSLCFPLFCPCGLGKSATASCLSGGGGRGSSGGGGDAGGGVCRAWWWWWWMPIYQSLIDKGGVPFQASHHGDDLSTNSR